MKHSALFLMLLMAGSATADLIDDPWSQLPALPTSCFHNSDDFFERLDATSSNIATEETRQDEINAAISSELKNMDLMDQQQHMMTFMMEHPQQAQEYMQTVSQMGQTAVEEITTAAEQRIAFNTEATELVTRYDAAIEEALAPSLGRYKDWVRRYMEENAPEPEGKRLVAEYNAAYEGFCATWWNEAGPIHEYFGRLRQSYVGEAGLNDTKLPEVLRPYEIMGISTEGYRSTEAIKAARRYLWQVREVFVKRWQAPMEYSRPI